jgi:hypothetical protein
LTFCLSAQNHYRMCRMQWLFKNIGDRIKIKKIFSFRLTVAIAFVSALAPFADPTHAQSADPRYQTRTSDCRHEPPPGRALAVRRSDSGIINRGYVSERVLTQTADARLLKGGELLICTEYGRVEIVDSDDGQVRLQIRMEGFGEGSALPAEAARRGIDETKLQAFMTASQGRLMVRVWHSTLGFTTPGAQPTYVSVRLQVPARGAYRITTEAFHGLVAIRRLTLAGAILRGNVGDKLKGISGYLGATELDNVELIGDVDIDNLVGLPGIRPPVPANLANLAAPILVKARVGQNCQLKAVTGGDINIVIQPAGELGVKALAESNTDRVTINLDDGVADEPAGESKYNTRGLVFTEGFDTKKVRLNVHAISGTGRVSITSIPAAPVSRPL